MQSTITKISQFAMHNQEVIVLLYAFDMYPSIAISTTEK